MTALSKMVVGANPSFFPHLTILLRDFELDPAEAGFDTLDEWLEAMIRIDHATNRPVNAFVPRASIASTRDSEGSDEFQDVEEEAFSEEDGDFEDAEEGDHALPASAVRSGQLVEEQIISVPTGVLEVQVVCEQCQQPSECQELCWQSCLDILLAERRAV